jgi:hypothetical protein
VFECSNKRLNRVSGNLLGSLRAGGAQEQAATLAGRAAAHIPLDNPDAVASLLDSLRAAGAQEQAAALTGRLPGAGMFELFRKQEDRQDRFRFGREADGSPAGPWGLGRSGPIQPGLVTRDPGRCP